MQDVFSDSEFPYGSAEGREACLGFLNTGIWYSKKGGTQAKILEEALKPVLKGIQNLDPMVKMNVSLYENLCSIALLTGNLPLARQVAEGLSDRLTEEGIQTGSRNFALARVAQMEDKPAQALKLLKHSYSPKGSRKLRWYVIRVQLLGITGDWLALESEVEAFRKWLDYNSEVDGPEEIQNYLDWLSVIRRILNVKSGSKQAVAKINEDIQQCGLFQDYLKKLLGMVLDRSSLLAKETARPK